MRRLPAPSPSQVHGSSCSSGATSCAIRTVPTTGVCPAPPARGRRSRGTPRRQPVRLESGYKQPEIACQVAPQEGQRPIRRGVPPRLSGKCRVECVRWPMCAACADNSARVPEYRQPPSRRVDDLVCPQPPPRYRAAPSHGAQASHGGSSSTGVRVAGRARPASRAVRRGTERSAP